MSSVDSMSGAELQDVPREAAQTTPPHEQGGSRGAKNDAISAQGKAGRPATLSDAMKELEMQDKIIEALQRDNEGFSTEKRQLAARIKELEDTLANLEAKHSLMLSAQVTQEREKTVPSESEGTTAKLRARINELEFQLEDASESIKSAETELARHKNCATKLEVAEAEIQNLHTSLRRMEKEQHKNLEEMAKRIHSFAEDGSYQTETEARLREQEETIRQLRTELSDALAAGAQKRGEQRPPKEVHTLNRRIVELEEQLRLKSSESIADLIRSCQPPAQDSQLFKRQSAQIEQMKEALSAKDKFTEAALERLRLESAQVRRQYEEKLLEAETKLSQYQRGERDQQAKIRELEKEAHSLRRDLANASTQVGSMRAAIPSHKENSDSKGLAEENANLREQVRSLQSSHCQHTDQSAAAGALQALVKSLGDEVAAYKKLAEESQRIAQETNDRAERRVLQWKQEMMAQIQAAREDYNREIDRLQRTHQNDLVRALERHTGDVDSNTDTLQRWRSVLEEQGQEGFLHTVLDRLQFLEKRYQQKEKEFMYELTESKRSFELERSMEAQKYELKLERKNQQINDFRTQLDQLLSQVALLSAQSA